eukprot:4692524-Pyramimonas_sp.AAC.1
MVPIAVAISDGGPIALAGGRAQPLAAVAPLRSCRRPSVSRFLSWGSLRGRCSGRRRGHRAAR